MKVRKTNDEQNRTIDQEESITMVNGWKCPVCGSAWAPWYAGPCQHVAIIDRTDTNYQDTASCIHEWSSLGNSTLPRCAKCGCIRELTK